MRHVRQLLLAHDRADHAAGKAGSAATQAAVVSERFNEREDSNVVRELRHHSVSEEPVTHQETVIAPIMLMAAKTYSGAELLAKGNCYFTPSNGEATALLWERRLHRGTATMKRVLANQGVTGVRVKGAPTVGAACDTCARAKAHRRTFPLSTHPATQPGERLAMDVLGPFAVPGVNGERYIVNIVDKYSGYTIAEAVRSKADVTTTVVRLVKQADRIHRVQAVMWDGGTEFETIQMTVAMQELGIPILRNAPYTPQEMALAETKRQADCH